MTEERLAEMEQIFTTQFSPGFSPTEAVGLVTMAQKVVPELIAEVRRLREKIDQAIGDLINMDPALETIRTDCALDHLREALYGEAIK